MFSSQLVISRFTHAAGVLRAHNESLSCSFALGFTALTLATAGYPSIPLLIPFSLLGILYVKIHKG